MICFPNSKINLGLNIISKRPDGFHEVETCMYPIPFNDILEIVPATDGVFSLITSGIEIPDDGKPNLCERAYRLLDCPAVKIFLHKVIPPGTGLGAGSANAASTLLTINKLFDIGLDNSELKEKALQLGSDCPFFIDNTPAIAKGRGEILEPSLVDLSGLYLAIVTPKIHVSTALAYSLIKPEKPKHKISEIVQLPLNIWKEYLKNDFETAIFDMYPFFAEIKHWLYQSGATYASMSGSGSAFFGIFENEPTLNTFKGLKPIIFRLKGNG